MLLLGSPYFALWLPYHRTALSLCFKQCRQPTLFTMVIVMVQQARRLLWLMWKHS
jgi:hypothetical protein